MLEEPIGVILLVTKAFDQVGVLYVIGGSFASSVHGVYRASNDVDLVADLAADDVGPFVDALFRIRGTT